MDVGLSSTPIQRREAAPRLSHCSCRDPRRIAVLAVVSSGSSSRTRAHAASNLVRAPCTGLSPLIAHRAP